MRTAIILGTRPEIIKMSPIIRALRDKSADFFVLHTGQHYSRNMNAIFFENLGLSPPDINIRVGSGSHGEETGRMLMGIERKLAAMGATAALVEGDTNTVLAGVLAGAKAGVRMGHIEAGLRSGDRRMPEEINRIVADHIADVLFAPTNEAKENLVREGIAASRVLVTGNTIVDAVKQNLAIANSTDLAEWALVDSDYVLATIHRQENVDRRERLAGILRGIEGVARMTGVPVLYPVHPRSRKLMRRFGIKLDPRLVRLTKPVDFLTFLRMESKAKLVLTDSGGVQEEACILRVPCVTVRGSTERPETVEVGANIVSGTQPSRIVGAAKEMLGRERRWKNPFGDGKAGTRIVEAWLRES